MTRTHVDTSREIADMPLLVLRLRGSQARMGEQHGALMRAHGGHHAAVEFYGRMGARMIGATMPTGVRSLLEGVAGGVLGASARVLSRERARVFPEYAARTEALVAAAGFSSRTGDVFLSMDALQNVIGRLGGFGFFGKGALGLAAVPACSSLAVWGDASRDGSLLHARNFDFPGVGVWDEAPTVVFCDPDEGLRYGFVSTRGADAPGITGFNEAGLTLTAHTRFHADVRFTGPAVVDLGHEIVRRSRSIADAVDIAKRHGASSSWGFLISSAAERSAALVEIAGRDVAVTEPQGSHLSTTNSYHHAGLAEREVRPSLAFDVDSRSRCGRLERAVREAEGGLDPEALETLLGDYGGAAASEDGARGQRLAGDCLVSPITVQSIVAEPEQRRMRVSIGRAPAGFGPYVPVDWAWDGPVGAVEVAPAGTEVRGAAHDGRPLTAEARALSREYAFVCRLNLLGGHDAEIGSRLEGLVERAPSEPHFRFLASLFAMREGAFDRAAAHLEAAITSGGTESRLGRLRLWAIRVAVVRGREEDAQRHRDALLAMRGKESAPSRAAARGEIERPITKAQLRRVVPDFLQVGGAVAGTAH